MKKNKMLVLLVLLSSVTMCACDSKDLKEEVTNEVVTSESTETVEVTDMTDSIDYSGYDDLIKKVTEEIKGGMTQEEADSLGISYAFCYDIAVDDTRGYLRRDLDGDGIEELILGNNIDNGEIYDVYTLKDGKMVHTIMGWERCFYTLCENGTLANYGSGGASFYGYTYYNYNGQIITNGTTDGLIESVTYDGGRDANNPWFYSNTNIYDQDAEPITVEKVNEIMSCYEYVTLEFTTFK